MGSIQAPFRGSLHCMKGTVELEAVLRKLVEERNGDDPEANVSGKYFYHQQRREPHPATRDQKKQDRLFAACERLSGVSLPRVQTARDLGTKQFLDIASAPF
jgi:hypothetical protein